MSDQTNKPEPDTVLERLNGISPSFCPAKWLQVTLDLVHGATHSCHHPARHRIPLEELRTGPHALHNTQFKKHQRKLMLEGSRPPECAYCWSIEDAGSTYSDRVIKSSDPWALPLLERVAGLPWDSDVTPTYLEVMLDNLCNFSCAYCMSDISTSVAAEMKRHGPYPVVSSRDHRMPDFPAIPEPNPYVSAFFEWLPAIYPGLRVLRITGGEPLLSPRFPELLARLSELRNPDLTLAINSHLGVRIEALDRVIETVEELLRKKHISQFQLYTSIDATGAAAEYIRHGLNYRRFMSNIVAAARRIPRSEVVVMSTFNILSIGSLGDLLRTIADLKNSCPNIILDTSFLHDPNYLSASISTPDLQEKATAALAWLDADPGLPYSEHEKSKIRNAVLAMKTPPPAQCMTRWRRDFCLFIHEYDKRKKSHFLETFPEYRDFYTTCKRAFFD